MYYNQVSWTLNWITQYLKVSNIESYSLESFILMSYISDLLKYELLLDLSEHKKKLNYYQLKLLFSLIERRALFKEPIAYLVEQQSFYDLSFYVNRNVLIPRPETELMIDYFMKAIHSESEKDYLSILDIGTGSGCIALSLGVISGCKIIASDISINALKVASKNLKILNRELNPEVVFYESDLTLGIKREKLNSADLIFANLPYIAESDVMDLMLDVRNFEPKSALETNQNGLFLISRLIHLFYEYCSYPTKLIIEAGFNQKQDLLHLFHQKKLILETIITDYQGHERIYILSKKNNHEESNYAC